MNICLRIMVLIARDLCYGAHNTKIGPSGWRCDNKIELNGVSLEKLGLKATY